MINFVYNFPVKLGLPSIALRPIAIKNKPNNYASNPILDKNLSKVEIMTIIQKNQRIKNLLKEYNIPLEINLDNLETIKYGHLYDTYNTATRIYMSLPENLKNCVNLEDLQSAAILHDYGKILIPEKILNKKGKFNSDERKIMELHSEFGYELLKDMGLSQKILNLIKYHHQNPNKSGYPCVNGDYEFNLEHQILSLADKYSALREKRSYKNPLAKYETLEIIAKEVNQGNVCQEVYTALLKSESK